MIHNIRSERQNQTNYTWKWHLSFICGSIELVFSDGIMKEFIRKWSTYNGMNCEPLDVISLHSFRTFSASSSSFFLLYFVIQIGNSTPLMTLPVFTFHFYHQSAWNARAISYTANICFFPHRQYWNETEIWFFYSSPFFRYANG